MSLTKLFIARIPSQDLIIDSTQSNEFKSKFDFFNYLITKNKNQRKERSVVFFNESDVNNEKENIHINLKDFTRTLIHGLEYAEFEFKMFGKKQKFWIKTNKKDIITLDDSPDNFISINSNLISDDEKVIVDLEFTKDLLYPEKKRYSIKPIVYPELWKQYKNHESLEWKSEDISPEKDKSDFNKLLPSEKHCLKEVLAFFACADFIVMENLEHNFISECHIPEINMFYTFQARIEQVHSEVYANLIDDLIDDPAEKKRLFNSVENHPIIMKKAQWMGKYMVKRENETNIFNTSYPERLISFACTEGIHFSSSFAYLLYFKSKGILKQVTLSNELISRDEGLHAVFACIISYFIRAIMPSQEVAHRIIKEAVEIECQSVDHSLPKKMEGMNSDLMKIYVKNTANILCEQMGYDTIYDNVYNPFDWMELQIHTIKSNFFEQRPSEYKETNVQINWNNDLKKQQVEESDDDEEFDEDVEWSDEEEECVGKLNDFNIDQTIKVY